MNRMARTRSISIPLSIWALALLAAAVALWFMTAGDGPAYGNTAPRPDITVAANPYNPQVSSAPVAQLARYWGTPAANSAYAYGETLGVELVFSEAVTVTGVPYLELQIGTAIKHANYYEGSGTATLRFQYRVVNGDTDTDGFSINGHSALKLGTGTIKSVAMPSRDAFTASLPLTVWGIVQNNAGHKVDGAPSDYDSNDNGLIEVSSLAQLDAIRYDLNGNGAADNTADNSRYAAAFPNPAAGMGCQPADHDGDATTAKIPVCAGYELTQDLDFDTDGDGATYTVSPAGVVTGDAGDAYYNGGKGWTPIGVFTRTRNPDTGLEEAAGGFAATFDGKDKTIANLFINRTDSLGGLGLFGSIDGNGTVKNLGLPGVSVNFTSTTGATIGSLVGSNHGLVSNCYATGSVTTDAVATGSIHTVGGLAGYIRFDGIISSSYAAVAVSGKDGLSADSGGRHRLGGLVGRASRRGSTVIASYATGPVTGGAYGKAGGLVGTFTRGSIIASYATGPVAVGANGNAGGLVGHASGGTITASYAAGAVAVGANGKVGGLIGDSGGTSVVNSYWDTGATGQATSAGGGATGKTTRDLQSPTGYIANGIYANWNSDVDNADGDNNTATGVDDPWDFGTSRQYPVLKYGGLDPAKQRRVSIQADNWNAPVVGEPVTAALDLYGATVGIWQWQSSADGATWTDIASATSAIYVPVAADAASGGKFLRAKVTFTASGQSQTLTTVNTAKVIAASTAPTASTTAAIPIVGQKLRYAITGVTAANTASWWWQRCDNAAMTTNCKVRVQSNATSDAHTEYVPVAGTDSDVGKYLQAYAYYSDSGNSNAWTRTQTAILGPVVAAPVPTPTPPAAP